MPTIVEGLSPLPRGPISSKFERSPEVTIGQYDEYLAALGKNRTGLAIANTDWGQFHVFWGKDEAAVFNEYIRYVGPLRGDESHTLSYPATLFKIATPKSSKSPRSPSHGVTNISWWEMLAFAKAHEGSLPKEQHCRLAQHTSGTHGVRMFWLSGGKPGRIRPLVDIWDNQTSEHLFEKVGADHRHIELGGFVVWGEHYDFFPH